MTLHPPPLTLPPQRCAVKNIHDSFELSEIRFPKRPRAAVTFLFESGWIHSIPLM
jgi:hypothetical protein